MMNDLIKAKEMLIKYGYTCAICKDEEFYTSKLRGVKPLVSWYERNLDFGGFSAADKVIGKATAYLYLLLGVTSVYAGVISKSALELLEDNSINVEYDTLVKNIINRSGDGICPFESAVLNINEKKEAYQAIKNKMSEMNISI